MVEDFEAVPKVVTLLLAAIVRGIEKIDSASPVMQRRAVRLRYKINACLGNAETLISRLPGHTSIVDLREILSEVKNELHGTGLEDLSFSPETVLKLARKWPEKIDPSEISTPFFAVNAAIRLLDNSPVPAKIFHASRAGTDSTDEPRSDARASTAPNFFAALDSAVGKKNDLHLVNALLNEPVNTSASQSVDVLFATGLASAGSEVRLAEITRRNVPEQKIAPLRFEVSEGRIAVAHIHSDAEQPDRANVRTARQALIKSGKRYLNDLRSSNCDKRAVAAFERLNQHIEDDENVVTMMMVQAECELILAAIAEEIATPLSMSLSAYLRSVSQFAAQFPDWRRYTENVAVTELDNEDIQKIKAAAQKFIAGIKDKNEIITEEVPKTLQYLTDLINHPSKTFKRSGYAVLTSIENLISISWKYGVDLLGEIAKQTKDGLAKTTSKAIIVGVLGIATGGMLTIEPIASRLPDMQWMQNLKSVLQKELDDMLGKGLPPGRQ